MKKLTSLMGIFGIAAVLIILLSTITPSVSAAKATYSGAVSNVDLPHGGVFSSQTFIIGDLIITVVTYNDGTVEVTMQHIPGVQ